MLLHSFKMIWNQKRANSLIIVEVAIAFVVVFVLAAFAIRNYGLYATPLGFSYDNRWQIGLQTTGNWDVTKDQDTLQRLIAILDQQPNIENVHVLEKPPFEDSSWGSSIEANDRTIDYFVNMMDDGAALDYGMELVEGRWFGREDIGQNYIAVMINRQFVDQAFPDGSPIGKSVGSFTPRGDGAGARERKIVGVFEDFRQFGELSAHSPYLIYRYDLDEGSFDGGGISYLQIKVKNSTPVIYEEELLRILKGNAPEWTYKIKQWGSMRDSQLRRTMFPYIVFGIVAFFLICMVAMGLFGVLWQNVTRRTQEIGLRRALGATASGIRNQIISELVLISSLGVVIAFIILVQLPILGIFRSVTWPLFWVSFLTATAFMLFLSIVCAYYPGKVATNYTPAEALHYE